MKKIRKNLAKVLFFAFLIVNTSISNGQTIMLNGNYSKDTIVNPFNGFDKAYSLKINGLIKLKSDTSLIRIILVDQYANHFLIYEAYPLITLSDTLYIHGGCDETCFIDGISLSALKIEIINASINLDSIQLITTEIKDLELKRTQAKDMNDSIKVSSLNREVKKYKMYWLAGKTNINNWTFQEKESFFGSKFNLQGFDYYKGGIFEFVNHRSYNKSQSSYISDFNWKNRHSADKTNSPYFDGDIDYYTGWITPVRNQLSCGTCSIFATVAAVEARVNLYYNIHDINNPHHADIDISEQDIRNCPTLMMPCTTGAYPSQSYLRLKDYRCKESDYAYNPYNNSCNKPASCDGEVKIQSYTHYYCNSSNEDLFKKRLMDYGPLTVTIPLFPISGTPPSAHAVAVVGFEYVTAGKIAYKSRISGIEDLIIDSDSPLVGSTVYNFKNSWGYNPSPGNSTWGEDGFGYISYSAIDYYDYATGKIYWEGKNEDPASFSSSIVCSDEDGDGYYWWGISQTTPCATCPAGISPLEDCDDSNRDLGYYDAIYACISNCDALEQTYTLPTGSTSIDADVHQKMHVLVPSGATLTINKVLYMAPGRKITVQKGGKLIISGTGKITAACSQLWQGVEVEGTSLTQTIANQGAVEIQTGGVLENAICAIKNITAPLQQQSGAIIKAIGAIFRNNRESLNLSNYSGVFNSSFTRFDNCVFETKGELLDGTAPVNFVRIDNLTNASCVKFQGCSFTETDNLRKVYGIRAYNSFFECKVNGTNINSFNNLLYGVYASSGSLLTAVKVSSCTFTNNYRAIYLSGCQSPQITANTINVPNIDTHWMPIESYTAYGVYLDASTGYKVEDNIVYCDTYGDQVPVYINTCGIYVRNSGAVANEIYRNTFSNLQCALAAYGINRNGQNEGLVFKCNSFTNCGTDIGVYRGTLPLNANTGIRRDQGDYNTTDPAKSAGNVFSSLSFQYHTKDIDNANCMALRYNHHRTLSIPGNLRMIPLPALSPGVTINENNQSYYSPTLSCTSSLGDNFNSYVFQKQADSLLEKVEYNENMLLQQVDGGNTTGTAEVVNSSTSGETFAVYTDLLDKSPFLSDTVMKSAVIREDLLPDVMLRDILVANPQSAKSDTVLTALDSRYAPLNDTLMGDIMANEFVLGEKEMFEFQQAEARQEYGIVLNNRLVSLLNDTTINNSIDSLVTFYNHSNRLSAKYALAMQYSIANNTASAEAILNSISQAAYPHDFNANEHNAYLNWINLVKRAVESGAELAFDSLQVNALWGLIVEDTLGNYYPSALARNCLINSGLLTYQEPLVFDQDGMKSQTVRKHYPKITIPSVGSGYMKVFPNPAMDYIIIEYRLNKGCADGLIRFFSSEGKNIQNVPVYNTNSEIILPVGDFPGNFLITLQGCSGLIDSRKIVLSK